MFKKLPFYSTYEYNIQHKKDIECKIVFFGKRHFKNEVFYEKTE